MTRLSHFGMALRAAQYVCPSIDATRACGRCEHLTAKPQWLRCDKGGFFVRPNGTCKEFSQRPADLVQVGPVDI